MAKRRRRNPETSTECDLCHKKIKHWVDGKTVMGPWANMCKLCFNKYGVGIGTGKGQEYIDGVKVRG
jgi:hypothetical protein